MSGIVGIYHLDGQSVDVRDLRPMTAVLDHRGPDGDGMWFKDAVGLGHRMLWNTPESRLEKFPIVNTRGDTVITADVRLDNREELCGLLRISNQERSKIGDGQLILAAYEKWEVECTAKLLGDFAFAIWDVRNKILFCARDRFGIKPFCYYYQPGQFFAFASQVKALLTLSQIPHIVNEERIGDYVSGFAVLEGIDKTSTFYKDIYRLPPANTLIVGPRSFSYQRYWSLDPSRKIQYKSEADTAEAFREVFVSAIRSNLRCASVPGFLMSGGMDSTSVVSAARMLSPEFISLPIRTFSAVTSDGEDLESLNILSMLSMDGLHGTTISPDDLTSFEKWYGDLFMKSDDLFDSYVFSFLMPLYNIASRNDIRIMLDGMPGDNVISKGKGYINYLLRERKLADWVLEAVSTHRTYYPYYPVWKTISRSIREVFIPKWSRKWWRKNRNNKDTSLKFDQKTIINPEFAKKIDLSSRLEKGREIVHPKPPSTIREDHANNLNAGYITAALERYDRVAAMYSVEPRHPFLETRLVEFCLALPWNTSIYRGRNKVVLKNAMTGLLPEKIINSQLCPNPSRFFLHEMFKIKKEYFEYIFNQQLSSIQDYVDIETVRQSYQRYLTDWTSEDGRLVIIAANLAAWISQV